MLSQSSFRSKDGDLMFLRNGSITYKSTLPSQSRKPRSTMSLGMVGSQFGEDR
jgi:hypothetical protein